MSTQDSSQQASTQQGSEQIISSNPTSPVEVTFSPTEGGQLETFSPTQQGQSEEDQLSNKRLKSIVWSHFQRKVVNGEVKAECNYCKKLLGGSSNNGTSHLHDHFRRCPRRKMIDLKQKVLTDTFGKGKEMKAYTFDQENGRKELASMIIMHEYPISMVDHVGFRRYSCALQPLFKTPSRNMVKTDILKMYEWEKKKTMKLLESNESRIAITTDMWTASNQKKGFMAITAHFIDSSWKLQSRIIR